MTKNTNNSKYFGNIFKTQFKDPGEHMLVVKRVVRHACPECLVVVKMAYRGYSPNASVFHSNATFGQTWAAKAGLFVRNLLVALAKIINNKTNIS